MLLIASSVRPAELQINAKSSHHQKFYSHRVIKKIRESYGAWKMGIVLIPPLVADVVTCQSATIEHAQGITT